MEMGPSHGHLRKNLSMLFVVSMMRFPGCTMQRSFLSRVFLAEVFLAEVVLAGVVLAASALAATGCPGQADPSPCGPYPDIGPDDWEGAWRLRCDRFPHLCGLEVESTVREPDLDRAFDIVFLGEGYTEAQLPAYRHTVNELIFGLLGDGNGVVGRDPSLFNFHRVDVVSPSASLDDGDRTNTALGGCFVEDPDMLPHERWQPETVFPFVLLAAGNAPDADLVVVVLNSSRTAANAGPISRAYHRKPEIPAVHMTRTYSHRVLTHELGHAFAALGDEYVLPSLGAFPGRFSTFWTLNPLVADTPNLSLDPLRTGWEDVLSGSEPGGMGYATGIYRPTGECRMNRSDSERFCPVCLAIIDTVLDVQRDPTRDDGPPVCGVELSQEPDGLLGTVTLGVFARDYNGVASIDLRLDGVSLLPDHPMNLSCGWGCRFVTDLDTTSLEPGLRLLEYACEDSLGSVTLGELDLFILQ